MLSRCTHVNAHQWHADLFAPDESPFPEFIEQFWSQWDHISSHNTPVNAHQWHADLLAPDESPLPESLEQSW
jgi:hypothetical protein